MSWRSARKALRRKPYLLDPYRRRNAEGARALLAEEGLPSAAGIMDLARRRAGMSAEEWAAYLGMTSGRLARKCRSAMPIRVTKLVYVSRRAAALWLAALLISAFMAFTPPGRALAAAAFNTISEFINGILYVISNEQGRREDTAVGPNSDGVEDAAVQFQSVEEMLEYIDKPVLYLSDESEALVRAQYRLATTRGEYVVIEYALENNAVVLIRQDWNNDYSKGITLADTREYEVVYASDEVVVEGVYSSVDKGFMGSATMDDAIIGITIIGMEEEELESCLCRLMPG